MIFCEGLRPAGNTRAEVYSPDCHYCEEGGVCIYGRMTDGRRGYRRPSMMEFMLGDYFTRTFSAVLP